MGKTLLPTPKTALEVFKILPEGVHCQVINNTIIMSPSPTFEHQDIVYEITSQLRQFVNKNKLGKSIGSPIDVFLDENNAFQPDVIYLSNKNLALIGKDRKIHGGPDLVVEVLSPGNESDDKIRKKIVYERAGVKEYFIVSQTKEVTAYYLNKGKFGEPIKGRAQLKSKLLGKIFTF